MAKGDVRGVRCDPKRAEAVEEWEEDWSPLPLRITLAPFLGLGVGKLGDEGWGEGTWNGLVKDGVGCGTQLLVKDGEGYRGAFGE
jgi:hypothetical protein